MKIWKKFKKYFEYAYTKIKLLFRQKTFQYDTTKLKFLFDRKKCSNSLVVVFSACTREGVTARYNYVRTLKGINANKLYILDDFAEDRRGCYYLGQYPDYRIEKAVKSLIIELYKKTSAEKVIFCGSSKGGWASLNFAFDLDFDARVVVCGAPQYFLGNYLKNFKPAFSFIKGQYDPDEVIEEMNEHLHRKILSAKIPPKIYLHYSFNDHTYEEHIRDLLNDMRKKGIEVIEDIKDYVNHFDVSLYFPTFLFNTVQSEVET